MDLEEEATTASNLKTPLAPAFSAVLIDTQICEGHSSRQGRWEGSSWCTAAGDDRGISSEKDDYT